MRSRPTIISPLLRTVAAGLLLVWIAAQVLCFAHCNFGVSHGGSGKGSSDDSALAPAQHGGGSCCPKSRDTSGSLVCSTIKSALMGSGATTLASPDLHPLYTLVPFALALDATATEPTTAFFRQAVAPDWVFTPEVSLGPAHRNHAPPFLG
jgi:hypothetical protein